MLKKARKKDLQEVYRIVQTTIQSIYPMYYPKEVVTFFSNYHEEEKIKEDIHQENVFLLYEQDEIVGTGSLHGNEICRVFVLPQFQKNGYGNKIMRYLEEKLSRNYSCVYLDASLPGGVFYEKMGYQTKQHHRIDIENGAYLVYEVMEKQLRRNNTKYDYEGRVFIPLHNTENGEVDMQTIFEYHQEETLFWAMYAGGEVIKGYMIGEVLENGDLNFHYQHINVQQVMRIGKCHSVPHLLENNKIELHETWQWLNGDLSHGTSVLIEK